MPEYEGDESPVNIIRNIVKQIASINLESPIPFLYFLFSTVPFEFSDDA